MSRLRISPLSSLALLLSLALVANVCLFVSNMAVNLPIWDDFDIGLRFINKLKDAQTLGEKFGLVLRQHNEHRIVVTRSLVLLSVLLFSSVNFTFLVWSGLLFLLGLVFLLSLPGKSRVASFLVASGVLLQPQYGDGLTWSATCVSSFAVGLLALLSGHLAFQRRGAFALMFPILALACFTQGNGIVLPVSLVVVFALRGEWQRALAVAIVGGALVWSYFQNYTFLPSARPFHEILAAYPQVIEYGFVLVGNSLGFSDPTWSQWAGMAVTISFFALVFSPAGRAHPAHVTFALFLFLSAGINSVTRGLSGIQYALSPGRYTILSAGIVATVAILALESCKRAWQRGALISAVLVFNIFSWSLYRYPAEDLRARAVNDFVLYMTRKTEGLTYPWPTIGIPIFQEAVAKGTFLVDGALADLQLAVLQEPPEIAFSESAKGFKKSVRSVFIGDEYVTIEGWGIVKGCKSSATEVYVQLKGHSSRLSFRAAPKLRRDLGERLKDVDRNNAGYVVLFPRSLLSEAQPYQLDVVFVCGGSAFNHATPYRIDPSGRGKVEPVEVEPVSNTPVR